jgi:hypothetical protein
MSIAQSHEEVLNVEGARRVEGQCEYHHHEESFRHRKKAIR